MKEIFLKLTKNINMKKIIIIGIFIIILIIIISLFNKKTALTCEDAEKIVLEKIKDGKITQCERERRNYEVKIVHEKYEYEFKINANTGEIIEYESELIP